MLSLPRANVEARDPDSGWTALHFASRQGKLATVKVLIDCQAFIGSVAPDGRTPLHLAAGWGTYEVNGRSPIFLHRNPLVDDVSTVCFVPQSGHLRADEASW